MPFVIELRNLCFPDFIKNFLDICFKSYEVLAFMFQYSIHLEWIFVCDMSCEPIFSPQYGQLVVPAIIC